MPAHAATHGLWSPQFDVGCELIDGHSDWGHRKSTSIGRRWFTMITGHDRQAWRCQPPDYKSELARTQMRRACTKPGALV
jgi:hypothetical protein